MIDERCWKAPTPTDLNYSGLNFIQRSLFREILSRCRNKKHICRFNQSGRHYEIVLNRGECIIKAKNLADDIGINRKTVRKYLNIISNVYNQMDIEGIQGIGYRIRLNNYDEIINMDKRLHKHGTSKGQARDKQGTSNKTVIETAQSAESASYKLSPPLAEPSINEEDILKLREEIERKFL